MDIIELLRKNEHINKFINDNNLSSEDILSNCTELIKYGDAISICSKCDGKKCLNDSINSIPTLTIDSNKRISIVYSECPKALANKVGTFEAYEFTDLNTQLEFNPQRLQLLKKLDEFKKNYLKNPKGINKGIYLYGKYGVGKSLFLYSYAKSLASSGCNVFFVYYPELVREVQSSFNNGTTDKLISKLKKCDILFLDDLGREANSQYIRDEVLGLVLQYRCDNNLPMFATSNLTYDLLRDHLADANNKTSINKSNAIIERMKYLMTDYELIDRDYRNN